MRIDDLFLTENLEEGPVWDKVRGAGAAVGKGLGAVGQGIGAVAGVPAGIARAIGKGYNRAADTIGGGPDEQPAQASAPVQAQGGAQQASNPTQQGGGQASAPVQGGAPAGASDDPAAGGAAQAQQSKIGVGQINKILPTLRARDLASVKKTLDATLAKKQKAPDPGAGAMSQMANTLTGTPAPAAPPANTMANAPVSKTNTAKPGNPNAATPAPTTAPNTPSFGKGTAMPMKPMQVPGAMTPGAQPTAATPAPTTAPTARGGKVAGQVSQTPNAMRKRAARAASKAMAESTQFYSKFFKTMI
jgi:hypothetical protein